MNTNSYDRYINRTHTLGRIFTLITLVALLAAPFVMGSFLGGMRASWASHVRHEPLGVFSAPIVVDNVAVLRNMLALLMVSSQTGKTPCAHGGIATGMPRQRTVAC